jgi:hypothetical protein
MTEIELKRRAGLIMLLVHLVSVILVIGLFFLGGFTFEHMTTIVAIIGPMFAGITTQIINYFANSRFVKADDSNKVTLEYQILIFAVPAILGVLIWISTIAQANSAVFVNFEQYKVALVFFEGLFATYVARLMTSLFGPIRGAPARSRTGGR